MSLTASQLADLRGKAKLVLGIEDDDAAFLIDVAKVYDDGSENSSSSTLAISSTTATFVGDTTSTDTVPLGNDTVAGVLETAAEDNTGLVYELLASADIDATDLVPFSATNIYLEANETTLQAVNNALLDLLIEGTLAGIESYLNRNLLSQSYTERVFPGRDWGVMTLQQPEVTSVDLFALDAADAIDVRYTGSDTTARVEVQSNAVVLRSSGSTTTTTTLSFDTYDDTASLASAIDGTSGWTATARVTVPSSRLVRHGSWNVKDNSVELQYWEDYDGEYEVDYEEGQIRIRVPEWGGVYSYRGMGLVQYTAGFESLPADLEQVVLTLIKSSYDGTKRDGSVISERLGDYAYQLAQEAVSGGVSGASITSQLPVLERYRRMLP